jgi:DNA oxidative demethylase
MEPDRREDYVEEPILASEPCVSSVHHPAVQLVPGCIHYPGFLDRDAQEALVVALRDVVRQAPLFTPVMPGTGKPFSVRMTNCGPLGWVSDQARGYRYQPVHPVTGKPWPAMPAALSEAWTRLSQFRAPAEACLINHYTPGARMGLHQDKDEQEADAPVVSLSLGDTALFRIGGTNRRDRTMSVRLQSGDALVFGGEARFAFHGIDRLYPGTSTLLAEAGRINLTLRRVTRAAPT